MEEKPKTLSGMICVMGKEGGELVRILRKLQLQGEIPGGVKILHLLDAPIVPGMVKEIPCLDAVTTSDV